MLKEKKRTFKIQGKALSEPRAMIAKKRCDEREIKMVE